LRYFNCIRRFGWADAKFGGYLDDREYEEELQHSDYRQNKSVEELELSSVSIAFYNWRATRKICIAPSRRVTEFCKSQYLIDIKENAVTKSGLFHNHSSLVPISWRITKATRKARGKCRLNSHLHGGGVPGLTPALILLFDLALYGVAHHIRQAVASHTLGVAYLLVTLPKQESQGDYQFRIGYCNSGKQVDIPMDRGRPLESRIFQQGILTNIYVEVAPATTRALHLQISDIRDPLVRMNCFTI